MTHLAINTVNRYAFIQVRENVIGKIFKKQKESVLKSTHNLIVEKTAKNELLSCKCCSWKGKSAETKKEFLFTNLISELELFCPKCNSYVGFISDEIK